MINNYNQIGLTGNREFPTQEQVTIFCSLLNTLTGNTVTFHHGGCIGSDETMHHLIHHYYPNCIIHLYPSTFKDMWGIQPDEADWSQEPKKALERDLDIVNASEILIALSPTEEEILRSGTWATLRYMKKANKPFIIIPPTGKLRNTWKP